MPLYDYTKLPIGKKLENGEIQECPHCGQRALLEITDGKKWYTHRCGFTLAGGIPQVVMEMHSAIPGWDGKKQTRERSQ